MKNSSVTKLALTGLLAAMVFASSWLQIPIATPIDNTRIHLGNILCLLSGLLLGPLYGGAAAGIGSAFFDLTNPLYLTSAPFTLIFKFTIGFIAGSLSRIRAADAKSFTLNTVASVAASLSYCFLYLSKSYIDYRFVKLLDHLPAITALLPKAATSLFNAAIAVIIAVPLSLAIRKSLNLFLSQ